MMTNISPKAETNIVTLEARVKAALAQLNHALDYSWIRSVNCAIRELTVAVGAVEALRIELIKHTTMSTRIKVMEEGVREQEQWIETHGATLAEYVKRYGTPGTDHCVGDGGEALYYGDMSELMSRRRMLASILAWHKR